MYLGFIAAQTRRIALATGADLVPKPVRQLPFLVTGSSRQSLEWIAESSDGWITYPRPLVHQTRLAQEWHDLVTAASIFAHDAHRRRGR